MRLIRHPNRGQFTSAVQFGKIDRVSPVRFDSLAWLAGDQRWSDHGTFVPNRAELSLDAIAARSGQISVLTGQLHHQRLQCGRCVGDLSVLAHFSRFGYRDRNRILVYVKADIDDTLSQDPSPMHEARYRTIRHNPRTCIL
jgi:hypothetical protein